jgi:hypothetical protein
MMKSKFRVVHDDVVMLEVNAHRASGSILAGGSKVL